MKFEECVDDSGLDISCGLRLDVSTWWNITYFMLESALQYRQTFEYFQLADIN
jgi:hypothetical protein